MVRILFTTLLSFLVTFLAIPSIVSISKAKKLFDEPDSRKLNKVVVPTMGGIGIFIGISLSSMLFLDKNSPEEFRYLFAAIITMLFVGIKDDILIISARKKLAIQLAAAAILVLLGNFRIVHTYGLFHVELFSDWISIPLSILVIVFLTNAVNLIDGIDGLAGGLSLLASIFLGGWFFLTGHSNSAIICLAFAGSLIAFLYYNLKGRKNKIFMGDTGSLILGVYLAVMAIRFNELNVATDAPFYVAQAPLMALALLIVPVTDTLRVFAIRIWHRRSPFSPDMNHFHHLLIRLGLSHVQATCFLLAYTIGFILLAQLFVHWHLSIGLAFPLLLAISFSAVGLTYRKSKRQATSPIPVQAAAKPLAMVTFNILKKESRSAVHKHTTNAGHQEEKI